MSQKRSIRIIMVENHFSFVKAANAPESWVEMY